MAAKHEIELFISDDGLLKVHIKGVRGPGCLKVLDSLTKETGILQDRQLTAEFYESAQGEVKPSAKIRKEK